MQNPKNPPDPNYVFHGSHERFEIVEPKRNIRSRKEKDDTVNIIFDEVSFHATPYKWIALAYMYDPGAYEFEGKLAQYNMGVDLYKNEELIEVYGFDSLEETLKKMYGNGGYLFIFEKEKFFHKDGLGNLEVITKDKLEPFRIEKIDDPIGELQKLGIKFKWLDLAKPEHADLRGYKRIQSNY